MKGLAVRNFQEHPLESKGKPRASGTIQGAHERNSCAQTDTPIRKDEHEILTSEFGESKE